MAIAYVPRDLPQDSIYKACLFGTPCGFGAQDRLVDDGILFGRRTIDQLIGPNADDIEQLTLNPFDRPSGERGDYRIDSPAISQRPKNKVRRPLTLVGFMPETVQYRAGIISLRITPVQDLNCDSTRGFKFLISHTRPVNPHNV